MLSREIHCRELLSRAVNDASHPLAPDADLFQPTSVMALAGARPDPFLLLIQKADRQGYPWRNQMAFPGGHVDPEDLNREETALRELEEEMNIPREQVTVVGSLGHFQTINNRDIEAFLGIWDQMGEIDFDRNEISRVFKIPLRHFVQIHRDKKFNGRYPDIQELTYPYEDVVVWGVTAKIIHHLMEILPDRLNGSHSR
ncbi:NUDIX domain-containing protein [Desulfocicer vacuolatum DSM 3385]|uniref:NUDIX domain-containing protein n=1 Tax=Desulfocicer vacuolatum DSM 3385 TaxID=1121400 RepID=A0A1W2AZT7_9BACT|nr:CoA pyrophosphatase [Desulfocicer vacuolatum]SMC66114.1 NUDIX domain-containing protein [Desulfocicer vacuolatum DSM 3385]